VKTFVQVNEHHCGRIFKINTP